MRVRPTPPFQDPRVPARYLRVLQWDTGDVAMGDDLGIVIPAVVKRVSHPIISEDHVSGQVVAVKINREQ